MSLINLPEELEKLKDRGMFNIGGGTVIVGRYLSVGEDGEGKINMTGGGNQCRRRFIYSKEPVRNELLI